MEGRRIGRRASRPPCPGALCRPTPWPGRRARGGGGVSETDRLFTLFWCVSFFLAMVRVWGRRWRRGGMPLGLVLISRLIGYVAGAGSPSHAAAANAGVNTRTANVSVRSNPFEPTIRALKFWRRVGPIVAHYKFTQMWMRSSNADAQQRAATWNRLHEMHAKDSLDVILEL